MESYSAPVVKTFFDASTWTFTHVVYEKPGSECAIIDSVLNYDPKSGRTSTESADEVIEFIKQQKLRVVWILETHAHADHLTAATYLKKHLGGKLAIGEHIKEVQATFKNIFNLEDSFETNGSQFDYLITENEELPLGNLKIKALFTPGHTAACMAYVVGDAIFVGDTMFMPDVGTARCDFPGGNANVLYQSVKSILSFPNETRLYMCHDYPPNEREVAYITTVLDERKHNIHINDGISEKDFISMRAARDATLDMPALILPAVQINIRAGEFPPKETNDVSYLKIPLNLL
ncbi:MBL fold metallo-hydrolase [Polynucleobacter asymbioticus]|uniref:Beta-lactamase domain protein n=1 Tax=Polynucleobacter asymbioticus (strain DSM 18221 / CIP 109841 / QLW-P1DMWA-1) TaxID=312153 RepID=A4SWC7_POLAQ|nr:MBL fold metallo-hydrolase [Polynucleobacter asymbioticus]ABP33791.1 beta-lactamase domain protein [Polynucleobacter asymbioticus QLW-P1DMWA-1]